jgi:glyoxylate/hydroxypyruvate reductase
MAPAKMALRAAAITPKSVAGVLTDQGSAAHLQEICEHFPALRFIAYMAHGGSDLLELRLPRRVRLLRLRDPFICRALVEYVTLHLLNYHRQAPRYRQQQRQRVWQSIEPVPAEMRNVAILGLGVIGGAIARTVVSLGFATRGWSRTPTRIAGVRCHHGCIQAVLPEVDVLINVLPGTAQTRHLLGADELSLLRRDACVINVGRGTTLNLEALRAALRSGQIGYAALDVTDPEPLPSNHPLWHQPNVILTPHIAGLTRDISVPDIAIMLKAAIAGRAAAWQVRRSRGY